MAPTWTRKFSFASSIIRLLLEGRVRLLAFVAVPFKNEWGRVERRRGRPYHDHAVNWRGHEWSMTDEGILLFPLSRHCRKQSLHKMWPHCNVRDGLLDSVQIGHISGLVWSSTVSSNAASFGSTARQLGHLTFTVFGNKSLGAGGDGSSIHSKLSFVL